MTPIAAGILHDGLGKGVEAVGARSALADARWPRGTHAAPRARANRVDLDPTVKDAWGLPAPRLTFQEHPNDVKMREWFIARGARAARCRGRQGRGSISSPAPANNGPHLLGTCRMGNDPETSVVDKNHRAHDVPNLFMVDGSSLVTGGRGQPTMTIMALAFRAGKGMAKAAKGGI